MRTINYPDGSRTIILTGKERQESVQHLQASVILFQDMDRHLLPIQDLFPEMAVGTTIRRTRQDLAALQERLQFMISMMANWPVETTPPVRPLVWWAEIDQETGAPTGKAFQATESPGPLWANMGDKDPRG